ncbi:MAG TPA: hypothetical protein VLC93_08965, partial [Myxococcota bacterium]|nr:hypothetical protein [Myxococcota bacterium]
RTLKMVGDGRSHNQEHHVMTIIGRRAKGGVYGGVAQGTRDFGATAIDSESGASRTTADIPADETLQGAAKTLAAAVGLSSERIGVRINGGRVITAAVTTT